MDQKEFDDLLESAKDGDEHAILKIRQYYSYMESHIPSHISNIIENAETEIKKRKKISRWKNIDILIEKAEQTTRNCRFVDTFYIPLKRSHRFTDELLTYYQSITEANIVEIDQEHYSKIFKQDEELIKAIKADVKKTLEAQLIDAKNSETSAPCLGIIKRKDHLEFFLIKGDYILSYGTITDDKNESRIDMTSDNMFGESSIIERFVRPDSIYNMDLDNEQDLFYNSPINPVVKDLYHISTNPDINLRSAFSKEECDELKKLEIELASIVNGDRKTDKR